MGMFSTIVFPFLIWLFNKFVKIIKIKRFKKLLYREYVLKIKGIKHEELKKYSSDSIRRLNYLIEKELTYFNNDVQFEYIRAVEYTNMLFFSITEKSKSTEFRDVLKVPIEVIEDEKREKD
ncbi:hypothetical protein G314FT_16380 [Vagococcus luciliae]|uniref:Uncharacterized protein n=2 Tax=Vagococcus luciliae TaxID=2920380 RepID=A0ABY5P0X1_9ENTE|nr:hypothetical protein G314FT_16380 [Vagococcus luciliae]